MRNKNPYTPEVIEKLNELHELAADLAVSYDVHFCEADGNWGVSFSSPAPAYDRIGKTKYDLLTAIELGIDFLKKAR